MAGASLLSSSSSCRVYRDFFQHLPSTACIYRVEWGLSVLSRGKIVFLLSDTYVVVVHNTHIQCALCMEGLGEVENFRDNWHFQIKSLKLSRTYATRSSFIFGKWSWKLPYEWGGRVVEIISRHKSSQQQDRREREVVKAGEEATVKFIQPLLCESRIDL